MSIHFRLLREIVTFGSNNASALIDTGAAASFLSNQILKKIPPDKVVEKITDNSHALFRTMSGEIMQSRGYFEIDIHVSDKHRFKQCFFILDRIDEGCILGMDFLRNNEVIINAKEESITYNNRIEMLPVPLVGSITLEKHNWFNLINVPDEHRSTMKKFLLNHYPLFAAKMTGLERAKKIKHRIDTGTTPPIKIGPRRTNHCDREFVKNQVEEMIENDIVRDSYSPYSFPVVVVPKKDNEKRFCVYYRQLNKVTRKDGYPLPRIDDTIDALHGAQFFSTLHLFSGYWEVEIDEKDEHKTAFVCEYGQCEYNRMPFGLTNAPATFQRLMDKVLKPVLHKFVLVYLDDIIVFSRNIEEHLEHLEIVFKLLAGAGFKLKTKKCEFLKDKLDYLGHTVSRDGVAPNPRKVESIVNYPAPTNVKELQSFLGLTSYYRKFIRAFAEKAHSLTKLTRKDVAWEWGNDQRDAFECIKQCLISEPILGYPDFTREFIVYTDASEYGIGAVLAQIQRSPQQTNNSGESKEKEVVIAYSSKHLNDRETKWSTTEKECFAIIQAVDIFKPYLYGRKFTVITDHRPLEWLMSKKEPSGRLARWALKIQEYDITIGYRPGKTNQNADSLSRIPILPAAANITFVKQDDWIESQQGD